MSLHASPVLSELRGLFVPVLLAQTSHCLLALESPCPGPLRLTHLQITKRSVSALIGIFACVLEDFSPARLLAFKELPMLRRLQALIGHYRHAQTLLALDKYRVLQGGAKRVVQLGDSIRRGSFRCV
ncbi:hypothetical protein D3C71_1686870 [compost metagenome]